MHAVCDMYFVRYVVRVMMYEYVKCGTSFLVQGMRYEEGTGRQYEVCSTRLVVCGMRYAVCGLQLRYEVWEKR